MTLALNQKHYYCEVAASHFKTDFALSIICIVIKVVAANILYIILSLYIILGLSYNYKTLAEGTYSLRAFFIEIRYSYWF